MSYEAFWDQDVRLAESYRKAHEMKLRRENEARWMQGLYFYEALCAASPLFRLSLRKGTVKPEPYVKEPYPMTDQEVAERRAREEQLKQERMKAEFACFVASFAQKQMPPEAHP